LEGLARYNNWETLINQKTKNKSFKREIYPNIWTKDTIHKSFDDLFNKFQNSILVVSYRSDGIPTIKELTDMIKKYKRTITIVRNEYQYALSKRHIKEVLIIGA